MKNQLILLLFLLLIFPLQFSYSDDNNSVGKDTLTPLIGEVLFCETNIHTVTYDDKVKKLKNERFKMKLISKDEVLIKDFTKLNPFVNKFYLDNYSEGDDFLNIYTEDLTLKSINPLSKGNIVYMNRIEQFDRTDDQLFIYGTENFVFSSPFNNEFIYTNITNYSYYEGRYVQTKIGNCVVF